MKINKKILYFIPVVIIALIISFSFRNQISNLFKDKNDKILSQEINNLIDSSTWWEEDDESWLSRVEKLRKRFSIKWVILKWDYYLNNNQPLFALTKYLQALKSSPHDEDVKLKIADTYFELKKWEKAYSYYKDIINYKKADKNKIIYSVIYQANLNNSWSISETSKIINSLNIDKETKFFYINSINCPSNFHACKLAFEDYLSKNEAKTKEMQIVKKALDNYTNFQTNKLYYKDALLAWAFYEAKLYPISISISKEIIKTMPWYKPIMLLVWKSYFELGDNYSAKTQLEEYYSSNTNDAKVSYLLWIISFNLKDYISSNLYYNNALKYWYSPKVDLERRLAYNYYLLKEDKKMLSTFSQLLNENEVEITDFSLWIYNAVMLWENLLANIWIEKAIKKYPKEEIWYWYKWWIYRENWDLDKAKEYLEKWLSMNSRNPMITLNMAYLLEKQEKYSLALIYAKKTSLANQDWEFWKLADREIPILEKLIEANKK